jgi:branched-chain amino acid transport system ATP-binding protein
MPIMEIDNLTLSFGGLKALDDLSFHVDREEIFSIIGPNGAGKTSLFNCVSGFYTPSAGMIRFEGETLNGLKPHNITKLGIIRTFQNLRLFKDMTVEENVMASLYCRQKTNIVDALLHTRRYRSEEKMAREIAQKYLTMVGLHKLSGRLVKKLPYGVQKRLEIARALAIEPAVVMFDEPAAGLNHEEKEDLMRIIGDIKKMGITVLLIEHDMGLVMRISERIIVLNYGQKIAEGTPYEIRNNEAVVEAYLGREQ